MSEGEFKLTLSIRPTFPLIRNLALEELYGITNDSNNILDLRLEPEETCLQINKIYINGRLGSKIVIDNSTNNSIYIKYETNLAKYIQNDSKIFNLGEIEYIIKKIYNLINEITNVVNFTSKNFEIKFRIDNITNCFLGRAHGAQVFPEPDNAYPYTYYTDQFPLTNGNINAALEWMRSGIILSFEQGIGSVNIDI